MKVLNLNMLKGRNWENRVTSYFLNKYVGKIGTGKDSLMKGLISNCVFVAEVIDVGDNNTFVVDVEEPTFTPHPFGDELDEDVFYFDGEGKL